VLVQANVLKSRMKSDTSLTIAELLHYLATTVYFLTALALFCFCGQVRRTIRTKTPRENTKNLS
jgi:hypothetical protein